MKQSLVQMDNPLPSLVGGHIEGPRPGLFHPIVPPPLRGPHVGEEPQPQPKPQPQPEHKTATGRWIVAQSQLHARHKCPYCKTSYRFLTRVDADAADSLDTPLSHHYCDEAHGLNAYTDPNGALLTNEDFRTLELAGVPLEMNLARHVNSNCGWIDKGHVSGDPWTSEEWVYRIKPGHVWTRPQLKVASLTLRLATSEQGLHPKYNNGGNSHLR